MYLILWLKSLLNIDSCIIFRQYYDLHVSEELWWVLEQHWCILEENFYQHLKIFGMQNSNVFNIHMNRKFQLRKLNNTFINQ